jgi:hypothetical protein
MKSPLDLIEARLQGFIESSLYFLPGNRSQSALAHELAAAIQQAVAHESSGALITHNQFIVRLHPANVSIWESRPGLLEGLARVLNEAAREAGIEFFSPFSLQLYGDAALSEQDFAIHPFSRSNSSVEDTNAVPVSGGPTSKGDHLNQAYLIINGTTTVPLYQSVVNLGRRPDNQIVIDDPRVSRNHAQLRSVRGRFVLFDLNSTGGTYVNGIQISQQALKPGDVISLAGVPLIYGEDQLPSGGSATRLHTGRLEIRHDPPTH